MRGVDPLLPAQHHPDGRARARLDQRAFHLLAVGDEPPEPVVGRPVGLHDQHQRPGVQRPVEVHDTERVVVEVEYRLSEQGRARLRREPEGVGGVDRHDPLEGPVGVGPGDDPQRDDLAAQVGEVEDLVVGRDQRVRRRICGRDVGAVLGGVGLARQLDQHTRREERPERVRGGDVQVRQVLQRDRQRAGPSVGHRQLARLVVVDEPCAGHRPDQVLHDLGVQPGVGVAARQCAAGAAGRWAAGRRARQHRQRQVEGEGAQRHVEGRGLGLGAGVVTHHQPVAPHHLAVGDEQAEPRALLELVDTGERDRCLVDGGAVDGDLFDGADRRGQGALGCVELGHGQRLGLHPDVELGVGQGILGGAQQDRHVARCGPADLEPAGAGVDGGEGHGFAPERSRYWVSAL